VTVKQEVTLAGVCEGCGADVRDESLFCYNCGSGVNIDDVKSPDTKTLTSDRNGASAETTDSIVDSTSVPRVVNERRRRVRERVNVVWERTDGPGYLLLLFAFFVAVVVILMLAVAGYLQ
jgi:hypothetical protein